MHLPGSCGEASRGAQRPFVSGAAIRLWCESPGRRRELWKAERGSGKRTSGKGRSAALGSTTRLWFRLRRPPNFHRKADGDARERRCQWSRSGCAGACAGATEAAVDDRAPVCEWKPGRAFDGRQECVRHDAGRRNSCCGSSCSGLRRWLWACSRSQAVRSRRGWWSRFRSMHRGRWRHT